MRTENCNATRVRRAAARAALLLLSISACATGDASRLEAGNPALSRAARARNVIVFLGDGMGVSTVTAARILEGQLRGESGEENWLSFETLPHLALAKTYNTDQQVPDSAGTMTAIVAGAKTRAGVLAVDAKVPRGDHAAVEGHRLETLLESAERRGLSTGVVSTARLTHATPAACYAHSPERGWEDDADLPNDALTAGFPDIARQLIEFPIGDGLEVALGGGRRNFLPAERRDPETPGKSGERRDGRDLTNEWLARLPRSAYVWNRAGFEALDPDANDHVLGLFEWSHMQWETDREDDLAGEPSLSEMTTFAIDLLSRNPKGYFLMVEAGRIDHGHHVGNAYRALTDTIELSRAVRLALAKIDLSETLVIVTADHSHTLTIGGYPTRGNDILGLADRRDRGNPGETLPALDALGKPYTTLGYQNGPGYTGASNRQPEGPKHFPHLPRSQSGIEHGRPDLHDIDTSAPSYLQEAGVPLYRETHGGEDVPVYAGGPGAELIDGVVEQNYLYHAMLHALGWNRAED